MTDGQKNTSGAAADKAGVAPDARFFVRLGPRSVAEIAAIIGARTREQDADRSISTVSALEDSASNALSYCENPKKLQDTLLSSRAGAILVPENWEAPNGLPFAPLFVKSPKGAFAVAARRIVEERKLSPGASVHLTAEIAPGAIVEPGAIIGENARIGAGSRIGSNAVIQPGVTIGRNAQIGPGVSIQCALIGDDVTIGPNAVIGRAGFGLAGFAGRQVDVPQYGRAILQDGVSIGAVSCVDRGAFGDTVVGEGSKIDNMVHVAHNVAIGRNVTIVACSGISGSVTIGDGAVLAGAVGVADHINIGAGSTLAARSAVICDIPQGEVWAGYPARPRRQWLREAAWVSRGARRRSD